MTRVFEPSTINGVVLFEVDGRQVAYRRNGQHYNSIGWIAERFGRWVNSLGQSFSNPNDALSAIVR